VSAIPLPRIEGKYEILEKIREGGMGAIYKVRHRLLDEVRVIKVMRPQLTEDEELKERFLREARLAIKLRHPNIAQLYDFTVDEEGGSAFIVLEYIQGTTLEDLLALHGAPPLGLALEIAQQSLRALAYLHSRGFIHRDISPDNLMLTEDAEGAPTIKLIDLGIAKILDAPGEKNLTHTGTFLGKVRYASPEQFGAEGATQVDVRGDLYSFGLVLYELLTCRYPITGRDPSSIIAGHLFRAPLDFKESDPEGRIPDGVRAVVLKALAKHPVDRFAAAQEMSRALLPFRTPGDVSEADLRRMLSGPEPPVREEPIPAPGSTQGRLDEQFGLRTTPRPAPRETIPPTLVTPTPERLEDRRRQAAERERAEMVARIEAALDEGEAGAAESLLLEAEATLGRQEAFASLYGRLEELQARREEEKRQADQARRQGKMEAAVVEIRDLLDRGELTEAAGRLDRAVVRFGGTDALREQWERLETLQRAEREAARRRAEERLRQEEENRRRQEEQRREGEMKVAVLTLGSLLDRKELDEAEKLLDETASGLGETGDLRRLRGRLSALRRDDEARQDAASPRSTPPTRPGDPDFAPVMEAAQRIAELLAQRETTLALRELHDAAARFGERAELLALRKRLAEMVLE